MKKLFSAILLICLILPIICLTGCEDKEKRTILEFYSNYLNIEKSSVHLTTKLVDSRFHAQNELKQVTFTYSAGLENLISTNNAYSYINIYNNMLDDAMGPMFLYSSKLSSDHISQGDKKDLYEKLDKLASSYTETANRFGDLERTLNDSTALQNLANVYSSYEKLLKSATNLSATISSLYYDSIMLDSNIDYSKVKSENLNLTSLAIKTFDKLVYYNSVYVDIYLETKIIGFDTPQKIISGTFNAEYAPYKNLNTSIYSSETKENIEISRNKLHELATTLYYLQNDFNTEYQKYKVATNAIDYCAINSESSIKEQGYKQFIDQFAGENGIAYASYETIKSILDLSFQLA